MIIEEIKNTIAIQYGYENFEQVITAIDCNESYGNRIDEMFKDAMEEYAKQMCIEQRKLCANSIWGGHVFREYRDDVQKGILNTQLATNKT